MADVIRLTLPARSDFAEVVAETAATAALRIGLGGAQVDRLRRQVAELFDEWTSEPASDADAVLVELVVDTTDIIVRIGGDHGREIHLARRQDAPTLDG